MIPFCGKFLTVPAVCVRINLRLSSSKSKKKTKPKMPKNKKPERKASTSDSDSGPDDRTPVKKSKGDSSSEVPTSWNLGKNRFLKLTEFKNSWYLDVREFYNADGDLKPGRKGIMLTMEQWQKLKGFMGEIDEAIKQRV